MLLNISWLSVLGGGGGGGPVSAPENSQLIDLIPTHVHLILDFASYCGVFVHMYTSTCACMRACN